MNFTFCFYELKSAFGHAPRIKRTFHAGDAPDGRYNRYFDALAFEIGEQNIDQAIASCDAVAAGTIPRVDIGGDAWLITVTQDQVQVASSDFEEFNEEAVNTFTISEFRWVLRAWKEFLCMPAEPAGNCYVFELPNQEAPISSEWPFPLLSPLK